MGKKKVYIFVAIRETKYGQHSGTTPLTRTLGWDPLGGHFHVLGQALTPVQPSPSLQEGLAGRKAVACAWDDDSEVTQPTLPLLSLPPLSSPPLSCALGGMAQGGRHCQTVWGAGPTGEGLTGSSHFLDDKAPGGNADISSQR